jgi:hypothetical protein
MAIKVESTEAKARCHVLSVGDATLQWIVGISIDANNNRITMHGDLPLMSSPLVDDSTLDAERQ